MNLNTEMSLSTTLFSYAIHWAYASFFLLKNDRLNSVWNTLCICAVYLKISTLYCQTLLWLPNSIFVSLFFTPFLIQLMHLAYCQLFMQISFICILSTIMGIFYWKKLDMLYDLLPLICTLGIISTTSIFCTHWSLTLFF